MSRRGPKRLGEAVGVVRARTAPATTLGGAQAVWAEVAGAAIAAEAEPVSERGGVLTVACRSATWAQELDLLSPQLLERLNGALEANGATTIERLRFTADGARHGHPS